MIVGVLMKKLIILFLTFLIVFALGTAFTVFSQTNRLRDSSYHIYIDPGHGGFDGGAVGNETAEKAITLAIGLQLARYLQRTGFRVSLTRDDDFALANNKRDDIYKRVALINGSDASLYVSIHANSFPVKSVRGAQTFYNPLWEENRHLAAAIQNMLYAADPMNKRLAKAIFGKYLIDEVTVVGCLVEVGFLTNPEECDKLNTNEYQEKIALMIYSGILNFLEKYGEI